MTKILAINGSYRDGGVSDQVVNSMAEALRIAEADIEIVLLRNHPIQFCLNCRECTQQPGDVPGECVQHDNMQKLIDQIENSDAYILASPTNFGSVTAVFMRFIERLTVYAYWPWGMHAPQYRKDNLPKKKALLVSSCAAPGFLGRHAFQTRKQLNTVARAVGAKPVGTLFTGLVATDPHYRISSKVQARAKSLATRLV